MKNSRLQTILGAVISIAGVIAPKFGLQLSPDEWSVIQIGLVSIGSALMATGEPVQRKRETNQ